MRAQTFVGLMLILAAILGLCRVKYAVGDIKKDVAQIRYELAKEQRAMHVLEAEWAHLIRPDRLKDLSDNHLGLIPASVTQMQEVYTLPVRAELAVAPEASARATEVSYAR